MRLPKTRRFFMPRVTKRSKLLEKFNPQQQPLFDDGGYPLCAGVLASVATRRYAHKGLRLVEDDERALRLVELLSSKWGVKRIAREMHIAPATVRAARRYLVEQGKLDPYEKRLAEAMEDGIEAGVSNWRDAMEANLVPASQLPVPLAVMFDKRQNLAGRPNQIIAVVHARSADLSPEAINASFLDIEVTKDSASLNGDAKPKQIEAGMPPDASLDATQDQPTTPPLAQPEGGGGGSDSGRDGATRPNGFEKF